MNGANDSMNGKAAPGVLGTVAIVGAPNVGKSVLFHRLTGRYVVVSNYPGTTVEVSRGNFCDGAATVEVIDTPGMYSFLPLSEEENVSRKILMTEALSLVLHVVDAKNLERMLLLTFELMEASLPVVLVLNMMDEARQAGLTVRADRLSRELGIPVVETVLTAGDGVAELEAVMNRCLAERKGPGGRDPLLKPVAYSFEAGLEKVQGMLARDYGMNKRLAALLLFQEDVEMKKQVAEREPGEFDRIEAVIGAERASHEHPFEYEVAVQRADRARKIVERVVDVSGRPLKPVLTPDWFLMNPFTGIPILLFILYWALYKFVGVFGAGTVVNYIEGHVFQAHVNPFVTGIVAKTVPWPILRDLFTGDYGLFTLGLRYAIALILPIVSFFFIVFSVFEDTGYLPRLAMLLDRTFKKMGLSGRAVIPMVLGLGCDTMATMVTRTLPTKRERIIATFLLALAVPCSAQLGVIFALLSGRPRAMALWVMVIGAIFLSLGFLISRFLPGERPSFYMELPPLRWPKISHIIIKTCARVEWYLKEVIPLFLLASFLIWVGKLTHLFELAVRALERPIQWMGLPSETAPVFLFGFFRRDYGAAGLYDLNRGGTLSGVQLVVACVALTLFLPCIAQFLMNVKERGWKIGLAMSAFILFFAFGTAIFLNFALMRSGVVL